MSINQTVKEGLCRNHELYVRIIMNIVILYTFSFIVNNKGNS